MKLRAILLTMSLAPFLGATTILDATLERTVTMHTGDALAFNVFAGSFGVNALAFGLPRYPSDLSFAFVSAPTSAGMFSGILESTDGVVSVAFGWPLTFHDGSFSGAGYQGPASILEGYLHLSPLLSKSIFSGGPAVLTLFNDGPDITVGGLGGYTLRQDLFVSLAGGALSVGAISGPVSLESQALAPEPDSVGLLLLGGSLLCGVSLVLARASKGQK